LKEQGYDEVSDILYGEWSEAFGLVVREY